MPYFYIIKTLQDWKYNNLMRKHYSFHRILFTFLCWNICTIVYVLATVLYSITLECREARILLMIYEIKFFLKITLIKSKSFIEFNKKSEILIVSYLVFN